MSEPFIGEVKAFAFNFAPKNWAMCNGQLLSIAQNQALFSILGTTYGGNGTVTFALPDLRGRSPIHWGQGGGLSNISLGQVGGTENVTLTVNQMPAHTHPFVATTTAGTKKLVNGSIFADDVDSQPVDYFAAPNAPGSNYFPLNALSMPVMGGTQPHPNMQPYMVVNYCICLNGIFPSRN